MTAMEIVEELSGFQEQPAQIIHYAYPSPAQTFHGGGGYWPRQVAAMEIAGVPSTYPGQPVQTIRYMQLPPAQPGYDCMYSFHADFSYFSG